MELSALADVNRPCRWCGKVLPVPVRQVGRGPRYCGATCRRAAKAAQQRAWRKAKVTEPVDGVCWSCGRPFVPERHRAGRVGRFCSQDCQRAQKAALRRRRHRNNFT